MCCDTGRSADERRMSEVEQADVQTISAWVESGDAVIVDVREPQEHAMAHVPGSIHIPMSSFDPGALPALADGQRVVFMCAVGQRSQAVASHLLEGGYIDSAINMTGGIQAWESAGYPLSR
jgi:rhodanese-related sulfurtransferase